MGQNTEILLCLSILLANSFTNIPIPRSNKSIKIKKINRKVAGILYCQGILSQRNPSGDAGNIYIHRKKGEWNTVSDLATFSSLQKNQYPQHRAQNQSEIISAVFGYFDYEQRQSDDTTQAAKLKEKQQQIPNECHNKIIKLPNKRKITSMVVWQISCTQENFVQNLRKTC